MKLSQKVQRDTHIHLTQTPGSAETEMSSKTMGKDLEDRWSFDMILDNESSQNFHRKFRCTLPEQLNGNSP